MSKQEQKKKAWPIALIAIALFPIFALVDSCIILCFLGYGAELFPGELQYVMDPAQYSQKYYTWPESLEGYTVNKYSYREYEGSHKPYEAFVDLTVSEEQLSVLLKNARNAHIIWEREAYYAEGYYEIVYTDKYRIKEEEKEGEEIVVERWAAISKVVYNPQTCNIIYEKLEAGNTEFTPNDLAYFVRFDIDEYEYVEYTS